MRRTKVNVLGVVFGAGLLVTGLAACTPFEETERIEPVRSSAGYAGDRAGMACHADRVAALERGEGLAAICAEDR